MMPLLWGSEPISYSVNFEGLDEPEILKAIKSTTQLTVLRNPPTSLVSLRQRAESDTPEILKILRAYGYYEAKIDFKIQEHFPKTEVVVYISPGPIYRIHAFTLTLHSPEELSPDLYEKLQPPSLGLQLEEQASSQTISRAADRIITVLSEYGFPFARIKDRHIIADGKTHQIEVVVNAETGPLAFFGPTEFEGMVKTDPRWLHQKLRWKEGELYDSRKVQLTQKTLIETGLFSSVIAVPTGSPDQHGSLPLGIAIAETHPRTVSAGFSYQTKFGVGATFGWEHRNIRGQGNIFTLQGDITRLSHSGLLAFRIPDFHQPGQDLATRLHVLHEDILYVYRKTAYSLVARLESKIGNHLRFSIGGRSERLYVTHSLQNGTFLIGQIPLYVGWANVNNLLNPTSGMNVEYFLSPAWNFTLAGKPYIEQKLVYGFYIPIDKEKDILTIAQKITLASLYSAKLRYIPIPERILGGTEETLRGYGYLTVSPLAESPEGKLQPLGGRSAIFYTLETRFRLSKTVGLVPFFDLGNVGLRAIPTLRHKWQKSVGLGIRYFTFVGPFRFDIGFPLDRRKGLDGPLRVFASIGQSF
jgi:translocation and assembly module TamA